MLNRLAAACFAACLPLAAVAADPLTLQLRWTPDAEFAGYLVAADKGFYAEENLDVTIRPGGPGIVPIEVLADGGADVIVDWLPAALVAREKGLPIVNISQPFKGSALAMTCLTRSSVTDPARDLRGKTVGVWFDGSDYPLRAWLNSVGIPAQGGPAGVTLIDQGTGMETLARKQADCVLSLSYRSVEDLRAAGLTADQVITFSLADLGASVIEDGIYALEHSLTEPASSDRLLRFIRGTLRGWHYAEAHPDETTAMLAARNPLQGGEVMSLMLDQVTQLTKDSDGRLDSATAERSVAFLRAAGPAPVLRMQPNAAWSDVFTSQAVPAEPVAPMPATAPPAAAASN